MQPIVLYIHSLRHSWSEAYHTHTWGEMSPYSTHGTFHHTPLQSRVHNKSTICYPEANCNMTFLHLFLSLSLWEACLRNSHYLAARGLCMWTFESRLHYSPSLNSLWRRFFLSDANQLSWRAITSSALRHHHHPFLRPTTVDKLALPSLSKGPSAS